jgi:diguanylate cyclase (GGDEF)-like protein
MSRGDVTRAKVGISIIVFASGPAAVLAMPLLQRAGLIADTPMWLLIALLVACSVSNVLAIMFGRRCTPAGALQLQTSVAALSTAWFVYATGWGSLLVIGYAMGIAEAMRLHGSRAWRPALAWTAVAVAAGEIAVGAGIAPTILSPGMAHAVAITTFVCLAIVARTLGSSAEAAEVATARIEQDRAYFRDLVQHAADVIALVSPDLRIEYVSPGIEPLVGKPAAHCESLHIRDVLGADAADDIASAYSTLTLSDYLSCEWYLTNDLGRERRAHARLTRRADGSLVLNLRDVTEQRALEAQLERRASIDALTGLPNRAALKEQLADAGVSDDVTALFIDLDGFKEVNDSLGHERGDAVLQAVAERIASAVPEGVTVGRFGGDEFLALVHDADEPSATEIAYAIIGAIQALGARSARFPLSASVGIAARGRFEGVDELLCRADRAMYRAKALGPGHVEYAGTRADVTPAR